MAGFSRPRKAAISSAAVRGVRAISWGDLRKLRVMAASLVSGRETCVLRSARDACSRAASLSAASRASSKTARLILFPDSATKAPVKNGISKIASLSSSISLSSRGEGIINPLSFTLNFGAAFFFEISAATSSISFIISCSETSEEIRASTTDPRNPTASRPVSSLRIQPLA